MSGQASLLQTSESHRKELEENNAMLQEESSQHTMRNIIDDEVDNKLK